MYIAVDNGVYDLHFQTLWAALGGRSVRTNAVCRESMWAAQWRCIFASELTDTAQCWLLAMGYQTGAHPVPHWGPCGRDGLQIFYAGV